MIRGMSTKQQLSVWFGIILSSFFLWLALKDTNFPAVGGALARSQPLFILPLLVAVGLFCWAKALRVRLLLMPMRAISSWENFRIIMIGFAINNIFLVRIGEIVRIYLLGHEHNLSKTSILATMVVERTFDFLIVLCFLGLVIVAGTQIPAALANAGYFIAGAGLSLLLMVLISAVWPDALVAVFQKFARVLPGALQSRIVHHLRLGIAGVHALKNPRLLSGILLTSAAQGVLMAASLYIGVIAVGLQVPVSAVFVLLALVVAAMTLPSGPGFFGTIQLCFVLALKPYGVNAADAFAASVFYHLLTYAAITATGLYYLKRTGQKWATLRKLRT